MFGLEHKTWQDLLLSVGSHRLNRRLTPVEVGEAIDVAVKSGTKLKELASALYLEDTTMLSRFRRLLELPSEVRYQVNWGGKASIPVEPASIIARLKSREDQIAAADAYVEHGLSKLEISQIVQIRERSDRPINDCVSEVLGLRPQIERRNLIIGAVLSKWLQKKLSQMDQKQRDSLLANALNSNLPELGEWDGHLGVNRFTLVGDQSLGDYIRQLPGGFEEAINRYLETEAEI